MTPTSRSIDLPSPDDDALRHSHQLLEKVVAEIGRSGPMPFDRYWELAMYEPGLGYYSAGASKFGSSGDFVTAPELGNVFARCVAAPVAQALKRLGGGDVLELGAGSGAFAFDLLTALEQCNQLPQHYRILERSAQLRARQQVALAQFGSRVQWLDEPPVKPWSGVIFANEVIDALAAKRLAKTGGGWREQHVTSDNLKLGWTDKPLTATTTNAVQAIEHQGAPFATGYRTEIQPSLSAWVATVTSSLRSGIVLFVDYGYPGREYYLPDRSDGTLICHYRHRAHYDPFLWPGLNDLSVSVDFSAVAQGLDDAGFNVIGFTSQAQFLLDSGLDRILHASVSLSSKAQAELTHQVKVLTLPAEMGEHVKVIGATRGLTTATTWAGFANDQRYRL